MATGMDRTRIVRVNFAGEEELLSLPRIGRGIARRIIDDRELNGNITPVSLGQISRARIVRQALDLMDFQPNPSLATSRVDGNVNPEAISQYLMEGVDSNVAQEGVVQGPIQVVDAEVMASTITEQAVSTTHEDHPNSLNVGLGEAYGGAKQRQMRHSYDMGSRFYVAKGKQRPYSTGYQGQLFGTPTPEKAIHSMSMYKGGLFQTNEFWINKRSFHFLTGHEPRSEGFTLEYSLGFFG